ncbi:MAG: asparagine--tRNA ligase [Planctomycetia bacterium]|nr:asparagine--tRNA ligase [Planctomycetia bacterium]
MQCMSVSDARQASAVGKQIKLQGWVRTRRDSKGGFSFIELNDGSCQGNVQIVAEGKLPNYETVIKKLNIGACIEVTGNVIASPAKGQATEVQATEVTLLGEADPESYPLQKKGASFEFLRTIAHLRPRTNTFGAMARIRNQVCYSIHQFFQERGFLYIHTPIITASDCEGAGELFKVTTLPLEKVPQLPPATGATQQKHESNVDFSRDFFGKPAYLTVSGQLQVESFACSLGKVYTFGPTFRAENSNTPRHLAEFWMIEPEMAFYDLQDNMNLAEAFIKRIIGDALKNCKEDMQFFNDRIDKDLLARLEGIQKEDFLRVSYTEAVDILEKSGQTWEFPVGWGKDLQSEHERYLTEKHFGKPVILYNYPRTLKPFYMRVNDDGKTVRAMDVLVPGVGEIIGGSQREERLEMLTQRLKEQGLPVEPYAWYLDLRKFGTVPHSGFGLGLERALLLLTGMANIRDVIPFPRTPGNAEF